MSVVTSSDVKDPPPEKAKFSIYQVQWKDMPWTDRRNW